MTAPSSTVEAPSVASLPAGVRKAARRGSHRKTVLAWVLFAPSVIWVCVVTILPIVIAIQNSFFNGSYLSSGPFVGWTNYQQALFGVGAGSSFLVSLIFTASSVVFSLALSLGMAVTVSRMGRGSTAFSVIFMLPWITSPLLAGLLWQWVVSPGVGPVASILGDLFGNAQYTPLNSGPSAMVTLIIVSVWRIYPFGFILFLASIRSTPRELLECSQIDGAGSWQQFRYVTFPALRNSFLIVAIVFTMHLEISAELPLVLTGGGPAGATEIIGLRVYREAFILSHVGLASALAIILLIINAIIGAIYVLVLRNEDI
jgi:multiple sugar transport system permease protein